MVNGNGNGKSPLVPIIIGGAVVVGGLLIARNLKSTSPTGSTPSRSTTTPIVQFASEDDREAAIVVASNNSLQTTQEADIDSLVLRPFNPIVVIGGQNANSVYAVLSTLAPATFPRIVSGLPNVVRSGRVRGKDWISVAGFSRSDTIALAKTVRV